MAFPLREKCPNTEFFLVRISPHLDWIRKYTEYLSVLSPNTGNTYQKKTTHLDTFHAVIISGSKLAIISGSLGRLSNNSWFLWKFRTFKWDIKLYGSLPEKCPNREFFLVHIFLYSDWTQENTDQKKTPYLDTVHTVDA